MNNRLRTGADKAGVVLTRVTPRVRVGRDVAEGIVAVGVVGVRAQGVPLATDVAEASGAVVVVVAVGLVREMARLADVQRLLVVAAVVAVVADWLHAELLTLLDHAVGVLAVAGRQLGDGAH